MQVDTSTPSMLPHVRIRLFAKYMPEDTPALLEDSLKARIRIQIQDAIFTVGYRTSLIQGGHMIGTTS